MATICPPNDPTKDVRIAEFKALRDESLRCAQLLANAVWVAVTGYAVTLAGSAAFLGRAGASGLQVVESLLAPSTLALLCMEAVAISSMYMSELWKYIRIGAYIRDKIEHHFKIDTPELADGVMGWEVWIQGHRAKELYYGSLAFLQLPVIFTVVGCLAAVVSGANGPDVPAGTVRQFLGWLVADSWLLTLLAILCSIDLLVVLWLGVRLRLAERGTFARPTVRKAVAEVWGIFRRTSERRMARI